MYRRGNEREEGIRTLPWIAFRGGNRDVYGDSFEEVVSDEFYDTSAIEANDHRTVKINVH